MNSLTVKKDFPIFKRKINKKPIVYLDSTASSLKPSSVIKAINDYYTKYSVNIFRGVYTLSEEATRYYEEARASIADFIHAKNPNEIIFVRNATEAINLVASTWGEVNINSGDTIMTTVMEHHANFVTWQELAIKKNARLSIVDVDEDGYLKLDEIYNRIDKKTKLLALTYISNVLGTINPIKEIVKKAKNLNPNFVIIRLFLQLMLTLTALTSVLSS
jgi:cysteine desulfurase/selenocysteine lyase